MAIHDDTIAKIRELPEALAQEVNDFVDFLLMRSDSARWQQWLQFTEAQDIAEADFAAYLPSLEAYEEDLANGRISW